MSSVKELQNVYRKDINGLRAVAVLLVLIFHLDKNFLPGGYLGVDIFLVISGYLITRNIILRINANRFSFKDFYVRRIKRLFPALGVTILLTLGGGYFLMPSYFFERLGTSSLTALFSVSNIYFWLEDGYFNVGSELKPLLHTWSLGLEEQFYLIWPLVIYFCYKFSNRVLFLVLLIIILVSVLSAQFVIHDYEVSAFFLLPFRIFEFGLGAICIVIEKKLKDSTNLISIVATVLGFLIVFSSAVFFSAFSKMPGYLSLIPCSATMLIIAFPNNPVKRIGEIVVFQKLGDISYSIYLAHWPIIVLYKFNLSHEINFLEKAILFCASILAGYGLHKLIEKPFKDSKLSNTVLLSGIGGFFTIVGILAYFVSTNLIGFKNDQNPYFQSKKEMEDQRWKYWEDARKDTSTIIGESDKTILLVGNSHAIDLFYALRENGFKHNIKYLRTSYFCYNFGSLSTRNDKISDCQRDKRMTLQMLKTRKVDAIYLKDDWKGKNLAALKSYVEEMRRITQAPIIIFGPRMVFTREADIILNSAPNFDPDNINQHAQKFMYKPKETLSTELVNYFDTEYFRSMRVYFVDEIDIIGNYNLVSTKTSKLLYFDNNHLTKDGAIEFGEKLKNKRPEVFDLIGI